jgi:hypothetical protein
LQCTQASVGGGRDGCIEGEEKRVREETERARPEVCDCAGLEARAGRRA